MPTITRLSVRDIRFPTSRTLDGSDAVHTDPDYSAAYVVLSTNTGLEGHGLTFTIGRGNEVVVAAVHALAPLIENCSLEGLRADMAGFWRRLTNDSQLRWIGPEKGALHLATAAVVNALWDLIARYEAKPLWQLIIDMTPEELVSCVDFRYIEDALTPAEAVTMLRRLEPTKAARRAELLANGYPAYTTSAGWLGYDDSKVRRLCREYLARGWTHFKLKVGGNIEDDLRRARLIREEIGPERKLMLDANQRWGVREAVAHMERFAEVEPWWIEEPTSADDVLGHATIARAVAPIGVATGEHAQNRVMFKQLMQADAIAFCQVDACRLGGLNEVLAVLLMAAKFGVPVCPHAGGVGLCEYVQHLSILDYIVISGSLEGRLTEYANHLDMHYLNPAVMKEGHYVVPRGPGYGARFKPASLQAYEFPHGEVWVSETRTHGRPV